MRLLIVLLYIVPILVAAGAIFWLVWARLKRNRRDVSAGGEPPLHP